MQDAEFVIAWRGDTYGDLQPQKVDFFYFTEDNGFCDEDKVTVWNLQIATCCHVDNAIITRIN